MIMISATPEQIALVNGGIGDEWEIVRALDAVGLGHRDEQQRFAPSIERLLANQSAIVRGTALKVLLGFWGLEPGRLVERAVAILGRYDEDPDERREAAFALALFAERYAAPIERDRIVRALVASLDREPDARAQESTYNAIHQILKGETAPFPPDGLPFDRDRDADEALLGPYRG